MFKESLLDKTLYWIKKLIPRAVFEFFQPYYHALLAYGAAVAYGSPSKSLKVIGVTGTKGKSTTVYLISKILAAGGHQVAAIGSLGYQIKDKTWPNKLKNSMPGRFRLQKFLAQAKKAGCTHVVLEVTSEGIKQKRHLGIHFDCAVFTNLHKEHLESHGSFENYYHAKQELFRRTKNIHVINADDPHTALFGDFPAQKKIFYGIDLGEMRASNVQLTLDGSQFDVYSTHFNVHFGGRFNIYNVLAALSVGAMYGVDLPTAQPAIAAITDIPGRMEFVQKEPFAVVIDYAHTPDSLEAVYRTLRESLKGSSDAPSAPTGASEVGASTHTGRLVCVLGAAGGGRDTWKRPEFGKIADKYADVIILTDEDPYDENPNDIIEQIAAGITDISKVTKILDRKAAITHAIRAAQPGDIVIITGKGSETSMALANNKKIHWSDRQVVQEALSPRSTPAL